GRVDKGSSVIDSQKVERERGITVFSKQARFDWNGRSFILMDTPGHSDFSAEAERVLYGKGKRHDPRRVGAILATDQKENNQIKE
ncbi:MAG: hypothetical protein IJQ80_00995, partial [Clostridia bacterium]|nr:hypothetical protein [Clostridia bacterium]